MPTRNLPGLAALGPAYNELIHTIELNSHSSRATILFVPRGQLILCDLF